MRDVLESFTTGQLVVMYFYVIAAILVFYIVFDKYHKFVRAVIAGIFWPIGLFLAVITENFTNKK